MIYFVNILYNIYADMQTNCLYTILMSHRCVFVLHTQYDPVAQFRL